MQNNNITNMSTVVKKNGTFSRFVTMAEEVQAIPTQIDLTQPYLPGYSMSD